MALDKEPTGEGCLAENPALLPLDPYHFVKVLVLK